MWYKYFKGVYGEKFNVGISNGNTEEFLRQICSKNWFFNQVFNVTIADADIGGLNTVKVSPYTIW